MYRKFLNELEKWEENSVQEPLLVIGARQVGKTWIIKHFCENRYEDYVYINLEERSDLISIFEDSLSPDTIVRNLSIMIGRTIDHNTPIFIDEIQQSEKAITSLKYFCESDKNYRIIGAGSLLGVKIKRFQSSFPVGKVRIENMYPMDFEEFLLASGEIMLRDAIIEAYRNMKQLPEGIHNKALSLYHDYLLIGGMPQMVKEYLNREKDVLKVDREILSYIRLAYLADMSKYVNSATESTKINAVYESIPRQLARDNPKFKYKEIRSNAIKRDFYGPIEWLTSSDMIIRLNKLDSPMAPLKAYENSDSFKIYLSDVGLLCSICHLNYKDLLADVSNIYKGAVIENYVLGQIKSKYEDVYYYKPAENMEIDLIVEIDEEIIPIEIKSGRHKRSTSLNNYRSKFSPEYVIRISENNFGFVDGIKSVPLYAVFCI